jgi:hypothetical protein
LTPSSQFDEPGENATNGGISLYVEAPSSGEAIQALFSFPHG